MIRYWYPKKMAEIRQSHRNPLLEIKVNKNWLPYTCITYTPVHGVCFDDVELVAIDTFKNEHEIRCFSVGFYNE